MVNPSITLTPYQVRGSPSILSHQWRGRIAVPIAAALVLSVAACSSDAGPPTPTPAPSSSAASGAGWSVRVAVATTDLAVGTNRLAFGVLGEEGAIRVSEASVAFTYLDATPTVVTHVETASFIEWPSGVGVYVTETSFDRAGRWGAIVEVGPESGVKWRGQAGFVVEEKSSSPGIGEAPPASENKTARNVSKLSELTTAPIPDPDLYQLTIAEAMGNGKPTVVAFATPAFCSTATCGPQVLVLSAVKDRHEGEADFIHVEVYDNPSEMEGDIERGRLSPLMDEWGLQTEPFTFVLDADGRVVGKFQGFATEREIEDALSSTLSP